MLNPQIGDHLVRVNPPSGGHEGSCQSGTVSRVDDQTFVMRVQVDVIRDMEFRRSDGYDTSALGSFVVRPDWLNA